MTAGRYLMGSDEWYEYECPISGIDFDVRPVPPFGSTIECSGCGEVHQANSVIGSAWAIRGGRLVETTPEWERSQHYG